MNEIEIKESELKKLLQSENTTPEELDIYFVTEFDDAFNGHLKLRENVVIIPDSESTEEISLMGVVITLANKWAHSQRIKKYRQRLINEPDVVRIMSEGDSWFQHPHPKVLDIIDQLDNHYAVYDIAAAGDTVRNMFFEAGFLKVMRDENPRFFLLSGGGNDILGSNFRGFLNDKDGYSVASTDPGRFLKNTFLRELDSIGKIYRTVFGRLKDSQIQMIVHGYDYVVPWESKDKGWVGRYLLEKGVQNPDDRKAVIRFIMDHFNEMMATISSEYPNVHYLDLRNTVREDQWFDEIHPTSDGFQDIALKYHELIQNLVSA